MLIINKNVNINFMWIPSHTGITGNEIADKAAFIGINELDVRCSTRIPITDCQASIKKDVMKIWTDIWIKDRESKGEWYASIQSQLPGKPWYEKIKMGNRDFITTINRLRFGHNSAPAHLARFSIIPDGTCPHCQDGSVGDVEHLIFQCHAFAFDRLVLASELSEVFKNDVPRRLNDILKNVDSFVPIYKYIKNTVSKI
jgi:hypothetical protein